MQLKIYTFLISSLFIQTLFAQSNKISMRDSRFIQFQHTFMHHWPVMLEHSIYSEKISLQHFRIHAGYQHQILEDRLTMEFLGYFGSTHKGSYQDYGAFVRMAYRFDADDNYSLQGILNPHYDTGLDYKTCFAFSTYVGFCKVAAFYLEYTTIPEFRQSEERVRTGARIRINSPQYGTLAVTPMLSIPLQQRYEKIRLHVNFTYQF